jgi:O-antigen ligase
MAKNVFPGYEAVASGRGYVWGRSIPLLWSNFIVGSGPDTFGIEFPQYDYVARYESGFENVIFTRPHNFFLQMGVQTGTLSLIAFLVFYGIYFVESCRRYGFRKYERVEEWMGFAVFLCTIGFVASGLANDSLIVVTPIFYVLLGMGMAINEKLCPVTPKEKKINEKNIEEGLEWYVDCRWLERVSGAGCLRR